jgi:hypothetical protein
MTALIGVDMTEVNKLAVDLAAASFATLPATEKVAQVAGMKIKKGAQKRIKATAEDGHLPAYPSSITYDTETRGTTVGVVVGPDKDRNQGALGNVLEYGTSMHAPIPHLQPALEAEAPIFEKLLGEVAEGLIDKPGAGR